MIIIRKEDYGCVFTLNPDTDELYYAPIYDDDSVNISEFAPVDMDSVDDEYDMYTIKNELIKLNNA